MAIELGVGYLSVLPSTDKLAPAIRKEWQLINKESKKYGGEGGKGYGDGFKSGIQGLGIAAAGAFAGIVALGKSAMNLAEYFSQIVDLIAAPLKCPLKKIQNLTDLAFELGCKTLFSSSEVAGAMQGFAKAGLYTATISSGALAGTLELAA